jgi:hypothetical protein
MPRIVEFPVQAGGVLRVQAAGADQALAPASPTATVERARQTLEDALADVTPALGVITDRLRKLSPDEVTVEFGIMLSAETGVVVAKGGAEVHFTVRLAWARGDDHGDDHGDDAVG